MKSIEALTAAIDTADADHKNTRLSLKDKQIEQEVILVALIAAVKELDRQARQILNF
jgi:hypothetical protein